MDKIDNTSVMNKLREIQTYIRNDITPEQLHSKHILLILNQLDVCIDILGSNEYQDYKYMVSVSGGSAPKVVHNDMHTAKNEANRLCMSNPNRIVSVLKIVEEYTAKVVVEKFKRD